MKIAKLLNIPRKTQKLIAKSPVQKHSEVLRPAIDKFVSSTWDLGKLEVQKGKMDEENFKKIQARQLRLCARLALDIGGIFDPTPICDGLSAALSLYDMEFTEAALSVVSMVPYLGDFVAKPIKSGTFAVKMTRAIQKGRKMGKALKATKAAKAVKATRASKSLKVAQKIVS
jgi:hypothetical protein